MNPPSTFHLIAALSMVCMLQACGGSEGDSPDSPGLPPTARAVAAEAYNGGEIAMLDGAGSTDPDGDPLRYTWTQTAMPRARCSRCRTPMTP
jgi:hypothetical protein